MTHWLSDISTFEVTLMHTGKKLFCLTHLTRGTVILLGLFMMKLSNLNHSHVPRNHLPSAETISSLIDFVLKKLKEKKGFGFNPRSGLQYYANLLIFLTGAKMPACIGSASILTNLNCSFLYGHSFYLSHLCAAHCLYPDVWSARIFFHL